MFYGVTSSKGRPAGVVVGPVVGSITPTVSASNTTAHAITMPPSVAAGDLLLMKLSVDMDLLSLTVTDPPAGWTLLLNTTNLDVRGLVYWKIASGTEDTDFPPTITLSAAQYLCGQAYRILAGTFDPAIAPEATVEPSWGLANTLWISAGFSDQNPGVSAYPFTHGQTYVTTGGTSGNACSSFSSWDKTYDYRSPLYDELDGGYTLTGAGSAVYAQIAVAPPGLEFLVNYAAPPSGALGSASGYTTGAPAVYRGTAPYAFEVLTGALPGGLALNPTTGEISGYATEDGVFPFTIRCTDDDDQVYDSELSITIEVLELEITDPWTGSETGYLNGGFGFYPGVVHGRPPYVFSLQSGALPPGVILDPDGGLLYGNPTTEGTYTPTIRVTDDDSNFVDTPLEIEISYLPPEVVDEFYDGVQGEPYDYGPIFQYGRSPFVYTIESGAIPPGLTLHADTGIIDGTPTTVGTYTFTIRCTDDDANFADHPDSIEITAP
jgi:hypothetical protein